MSSREGDLDLARAAFAAEDLPFPPVLAEEAAGLRALNPHLFTTRAELPADPYTVEAFREEAVQNPALDDYVVLGFDGHGFNSWAVHYYRVEPGFALFVQLPWGGAFADRTREQATIVDIFAWARQFQDDMRRAVSQRALPEGARVIVVASAFLRPHFALIPARLNGGSDHHQVQWNQELPLRAALDGFLRDLFAGRLDPSAQELPRAL